MSRAIVIGGGISGLSSAYYLAKYMNPRDIVVIEANDHLGGIVQSAYFGSRLVEAGPDSFITRMPSALDLATELGLLDFLISPTNTSAYIFRSSKLHAIPKGTVFGAPSDFSKFRGNSLISLPGQFRAALEPLLGQANIQNDMTIGNFAKRRWGSEIAKYLIDPLVGGIHAGSAFELSLEKCAPQYLNAASRGRSVSRSLSLRGEVHTGGTLPTFYSLQKGLSQLIEALVSSLKNQGVQIITSCRAQQIVRNGDGFSVHSDLKTFDVESVISAAPAHISADLVRPLTTKAHQLLGAIDYSSPIITLLEYDEEAFNQPLNGSGVLIPRPNGLLATAITFASNKWPSWKNDGETLLRVSASRHGDKRAWKLDDEALKANLEVEMAKVIGAKSKATRAQIHRWDRSLPQFRPFHNERIRRIEEALPEGVAIAGSSVIGVGIPSCIESGKQAALKLATRLSSSQ